MAERYRLPEGFPPLAPKAPAPEPQPVEVKAKIPPTPAKFKPKKRGPNGGKNTKKRPDDGRSGGAKYSHPGNPSGKRGAPPGGFVGAGRPKGSQNKATRAIREAAAKSGELPHEFMLRVSRAKVGDIISGHEVRWSDIRWAAMMSANFFAPKQSAIKITGAGGGPVQFMQLDPALLDKASTEDLLALERVFGKLQMAAMKDVAATAAQPAGQKMIDLTPDDYAATLVE